MKMHEALKKSISGYIYIITRKGGRRAAYKVEPVSCTNKKGAVKATPGIC
jgi:hypothetical protein